MNRCASWQFNFLDRNYDLENELFVIVFFKNYYLKMLKFCIFKLYVMKYFF
jgi:hypothetical protein